MTSDTLPKVAETFAGCVVDGNLEGAYDCFSESLKATMSLAEFGELLRQAEKSVVPPKSFDTDSNSCSFEDIKDSEFRGALNAKEEVLAKINPADFIQWMCIQFAPDPNDQSTNLDACYDFWFMVVAEKGAEKIAFFEIHYPE
ncbi:MAG: hypothetical protein K2X27_25000, partial [Candidatus Obscuribacterales bacterium]|nr:hypothetical protein [Candidatus Obscuribacterales bacterium]